MTFTIKNLRDTATGAYSASLYEDGKRVAIISDEGRGGAPRVEPIKAENWGRERTRIEQALSAWSHTLPWWYLTSHGQHPALNLGDGNYELAIGYLVEVFDAEKVAARAAKTGKCLVLLADGGQGITRESDIPRIPQKVVSIWRDGNWVAA